MSRPRPPVDRWFFGGLFAVALLPRLYVALAWPREPVWDGHYYELGARHIAAGIGYASAEGKPWCHYPVGYSGLLAPFYRVLGPHPLVAPVLNAVLGAVLALVIYALARHLGSEKRARIAGVLTAAHPGLIAYSALVMTEGVAALGLAVGAWVALAHRGSWRAPVLAGLVLGLTSLVRPQTLLCAPAIGWLVVDAAGPLWPRLRQGLLAAALASLVTLATVLPWTARNCLVMDGCALVSTNAGWNLAIGSFPRATGRFSTLRGSDGCIIVTGQVQQDRCWWQRGVAWITADVPRWLDLVPVKLGHTFDHESFPVGYLGEADPRGWPEERKERGRIALSTAHRALLWVAALGVVARPSRRAGWPALAAQLLATAVVLALGYHAVSTPTHPFWPLAVAIPVLAVLGLPGAPRNGGIVAFSAFAVASVCLTHAVFFGEDRYHMVVSPLLCLLAALALRPGRTEGPDAVP